MLHATKEVQFLNDRSVDLAMGPLKVFNPVVDDFFQLPLYNEDVNSLSYLLPSFFYCSRISVPLKNSYSIYGKSRQDLCVFHERYTTTAGLLSWVDPQDEEIDAKAGVLEHKNKGYAEQQALKEMMCVAGNLTANVLSIGKRPVNVTIYGMAADYTTKKGKVLRLEVDFNNNQAHSYCSDGIINVGKGLNWMLNMISPQ